VNTTALAIVPMGCFWEREVIIVFWESIWELDEKSEKIVETCAAIAYRKMKSSSVVSFEDVVQEGKMVFLSVCESFKPNMGATFHTWLSVCLNNHFATMVSKSYRSVTTDSESEIPQKSKKLPDPFNFVSIMELIGVLSPLEKKYIAVLLDPPKDLIKVLMGVPKRKSRTVIRSYLELNQPEDARVRGNIERQLTCSW